MFSKDPSISLQKETFKGSYSTIDKSIKTRQSVRSAPIFKSIILLNALSGPHYVSCEGQSAQLMTAEKPTPS